MMDHLIHTRRCVLAILISGFGFAPAVSAQNIECGTEYTVKAGDFLSTIAGRVYKEPDRYKILYESNQEAIGEDPEFICPGLVLQIPCVTTDRIKAAVQKNIPLARVGENADSGEIVKLTSHDGETVLTGKLLAITEGMYVVSTSAGDVEIEVHIVDCEGAACTRIIQQ